MKKLLTLILLLPFITQAQEMGIGLYGGYVFPQGDAYLTNFARIGHERQRTLAGSLRFFYKLRHIEAGLACDMAEFRSYGEVYKVKGNTIWPTLINLNGSKGYASGTYILPHIFANAHYTGIRNLSAYAGLMAGHMFFINDQRGRVVTTYPEPPYDSRYPADMTIELTNVKNTITIGAQAGIQYYLNEHLTIGAEFDMRRAYFQGITTQNQFYYGWYMFPNHPRHTLYDAKEVSYAVWIPSALIGLRYIL